MLYETHLTTEQPRGRAQHALSRFRPLKSHLRWRTWRSARPAEPDVLTSAELSECTCPEICNRDHERD